MGLSFTLTKAQLRMVSSVAANFVAFWLASIITTRDPLTVIGNLTGAIIAWYIGIKAEEILEEL